MKTPLIVLGGAVLLATAAACWSPDAPAHSPTANPLDDVPPANSASSGDPAAEPVIPPPASEPKKGAFDRDQANIALGRAAKNAHSCVDIAPKDAAHGDATVQITFSGTGKSTAAQIPSPFDGTPIGQCATRAFVGIIVPPFDGEDVIMDFPVDLKPDAKAGGGKDTKAPKKKK